MLFDAQEHEANAGIPWNPELAKKTISDIALDVDSAFKKDDFWPWHPFDSDWKPEVPGLSLFWGAASNAWTLLSLAERNWVTSLSRDYREVLEQAYQTYLLRPDTRGRAPGYLLGETGILTALYRFAPSERIESLLFQQASETIPREENELMWAAPGGIIAALFMFESTGHPKWKKLVLDGASHLIDLWKEDQELGGRIWTQDLYGMQKKILGAVHGFAGNVYALLRSLDLLNVEQRDFVLKESAQTLAKSAHSGKEGSNWLPALCSNSSNFMVQWCHGAPGIVTSFSAYPRNHSNAVEELLTSAGQLVWNAGPLKAPFGLCHGTAGNGYAFLKLYKRTGQEVWLERARSFAMHAILQSDQQRLKHGFRRYSLLTGDLGLAVYLVSCLDQDDRWPLLDVI